MKTTTTDPIQTLRKVFPAMRRTRATAIIRSGAKRTVFGCVCGSRHTCSTEWRGRDSKHVREWRAEHDACADKFAADYAAGKEIEICFGR